MDNGRNLLSDQVILRYNWQNNMDTVSQTKTPVILVIEDDEMLCTMYERKLVSAGYECEVALNGIQGVTKAKLIKPDLILLDIMMPFKDGMETLAELKTDVDTANIPVVMLTNLSQPEQIEKALESGAIGYMIKSNSDPGEVVMKVRQVLAGTKYSKVTQPVSPIEHRVRDEILS